MNPRAIELVRQDCRTTVQGQQDLLGALKGQRLFVTGGTGFVGSWIAELVGCLNDDFAFGIGLTLLSRSTDRFAAELPHLAQRKDVVLVKADVRNVVEMPQNTTFVLHAAATPDNRFHSTNPVETMNVIADGTAAVLRAAEHCSGFSRLLHVSSALVYGSQAFETEGIPEGHAGAPALASVASAYGEAKRYAETYCSAARSQMKLPVVTARPFAFVGPFQALDRPWAINNFLHDALIGKTIRVQGDGQTVRSYLYGSDAAFWLLRILVAGDPGVAYNVGSPVAVTLERLAQMISAQFSPPPDVKLHAAGTHRTPRTKLVPHVARAAQLGLGVRVPLDTALQHTIRWHKGE